MPDQPRNTGDRVTRVGHCKRDETDVYVGRGPDGVALGDATIGESGWLGNPYPVDESESRMAAIEAFRADFVARLDGDPVFLRAVRDLHGKTLGCWCRSIDYERPPCHADVIAEWADKLAAADQEATA